MRTCRAPGTSCTAIAASTLSRPGARPQSGTIVTSFARAASSSASSSRTIAV
jgi:hypothetical protein